jgi:uncharacterized membrane protein YtjA (UPF0391 family)
MDNIRAQEMQGRRAATWTGSNLRLVRAIPPFVSRLAMGTFALLYGLAYMTIGESRSPSGRVTMLYWSLMFLLVALVAAVFGFGGIAAGAAGIAKILFIVFLVLAVVSAAGHAFRGGIPS